MDKKTFALITDFGFDFSVASMKALILKDFPEANIVDIDHSIKQFSIISGAFVIDKIYKYFPEGTIFICVVDPGVGSKREPIYLKTKDYKFIGPNNGLFHYILKDPNISREVYIIKKEFKPLISSTFHGRDLFTPAAIEIARENIDIIEQIEQDKLVFIHALESGDSVITYIDGFGNIKTNITFNEDFKNRDFLKIKINNINHIIKVSNTFSEADRGKLLCYQGSNNTLEIAANLASAEDILKASIGDSVSIEE